MEERYPEWKALAEKPEVGAIIDVMDNDYIKSKDYLKDDYFIMSLEEAFDYQKKHYRGFCIERNKNKHDLVLPDEIRNYILDNMNEDESLPY